MLAERLVESERLDSRAYDAFEHWGGAMFLSNKSLVVVLTAYFDESYNQHTVKNPNDPLVYTVGCWLSTFGQWKKFNKEWRRALNSADVDWFHMSEYESRLNDYEFWSDLKRVGVLKRLHRIIKDHAIHGVTISVNCQDFDELIKNSIWRRTFGKTHYGFDVRMALKYIAEWADENSIAGPIHYVFAELKGQGNELDEIFRRSLKNRPIKEWMRLTGMWTKGLMRDVTQLQAADIVAYEINKRSVNHISDAPNFVRNSLQNLAAGIYEKRLAPLYFGREELLHLIELARNSTPRV
jgi:hypothetical protein